MSDYYSLFAIYALFRQKSITLIRLGIYVLFIFLLLLGIIDPLILKIVSILFLLFMMNELFLIFKVFRTYPPITVSKAKEVSETLMTFPALSFYEQAQDGFQLASFLSSSESVKFIIEKIGPGFSLVERNIDKERLLKKAFEIVREIKGDYIREPDLFVAYLFLTEEENKLFEKNDLGGKDIIYILYWTRHKYYSQHAPFNFTFSGSGVFDFFIFGWNVETRKYALDLTSFVLSSKFPPLIIGREKEYERMITTLEKEKGNNILLVGEAGTGKTSLVQYFAYESHLGLIPGQAAYRKVYELYVDRLMAGANSQGELEGRLYDLFLDIRYSGEVIIFIQNIENVFGQGGFNFDISGAIFQYLESGSLQVIGTTTASSYKLYLENKDYVHKFFDVIRLEEPGEEDTLIMLMKKAAYLELQYGVSFTYNALKSAVDLSSSYIADRFLPGKAISLLEDIASQARTKRKAIVGKDDVIAKLEEKTKILLASPTPEEKQILLHLEEEMHKRIIDQEEAVNTVSSAIRRLRSGFINKKRPIGAFLFLGPTGVGKTETAKALASIYFGDEKRMIRVDMSEYQTQDSIKRFLGSLPGEEFTPSEFIEQVKNQPFSLILLDEFEKAHPRVLDIFLQVFEDGRLTDNLGRTIPFFNTIIIATSNAGAEVIRERLSKGEDITAAKKEIIDYLLQKELFKPELINRFDDVVLFKPLGKQEVKEIAKLIIANILKMQEEKHIFITYDEKVIEKIADEGFNVEFGARPIRRYIEAHIVDFLSRLILEGQLIKGSRVQLTVNDKGEFIII